jgi:hypothetical protein
LWAGTAAGLYGFDGQGWSALTHEDGLPTSSEFGTGDVGDGWCGPDDRAPEVDAVEIAPDGTVWVTTTDAWGRGGVAAHDGTSFTSFGYPANGAHEDGRSGLIVDGGGNVWLPTIERTQREVDIGLITDEWIDGLARLNADGTWTEFAFGRRLAPVETRVAVTTDGTPWITVEGQLWRLEGEEWAAVDTEPVPELGRAGRLAADRDGGIWVQFWNERDEVALVHFSGGEWAVLDETPLISAPFAVAPDGTLWAELHADRSTELPRSLYGLASYDRAEWSTHPLDTTGAPVVLGASDLFIVADDSNVWLAKRLGNEYLLRFDGP